MYFITDIGGTKMRMAVSRDGANLDSVEVTATPQDFEAGIEIIGNFVSKQKSDQETGGIKLLCGIAGEFDEEKKLLLYSPNLHGWVSKLLKYRLKQIAGPEVFLQNDAALAGLGESTVGAGQGHKIVAYVTVGTGVGGARMVSRKIDENSFGFEPGHQIILVNEKLSDLESLVSGSGIRKRYGKDPEQIEDTEFWREIEKYLSIGLTNSILHWSPDILVLGGGLVHSNRISIDNVEKNIKELLTDFALIPKIRKGILGDQAGLIGGLSFLKMLDSGQV